MSEPAAPREPDRDAIERFVEALFRYADQNTYVSLRAFHQSDSGRPPSYVRRIPIHDCGLAAVIDAAVAGARHAANTAEPLVFCSPIATFLDGAHASEGNLACGLCISVDLDTGNTTQAQARLEGLLGPATVVVASGGTWTDPVTGRAFPKLHLHWRLSEPTRNTVDHAVLKQVRRLACALGSADTSAKTPVHPLRWPGTWHLKGDPRLARITALNPDAEVHLRMALEALEDAADAAGRGQSGDGAARAGNNPRADIRRVASALGAIPNDDIHWDDWNRFALYTFSATGGSQEGLNAWSVWSAKSAKHVGENCEKRWADIAKSPPTRCGAGSIFFWAKKAGWKEDFTRPGPPSEPSGSDGASPTVGGNDADGDLITEGAVAVAFTVKHRGQLRYDHHAGRWFEWNATRWRREETKLAYRWAHQEAKTLAAGTGNQKTIICAGRATFAAGVERLAQSDRAFAVTSAIWDRDPWLLGTPGGTVDLRTGNMRPAVREDYITKETTVAPADTADCPNWLAFLKEATQGDEALIGFLQRWLGYCLTGDTSEHALMFIHGPGGNGKGVLMNTVFGIMGDYAKNAAIDTFVATRGDKHTTDLAMLTGARLVMATEVDEGQAWAEARIKSLTGGDPITARFMRRDNFTFVPQFKLTISGNHKPALRNVDDAARRRFNVVPFVHKPVRVDKTLGERLKQEWPGILRWMIDGSIEWQQSGLNPPPIVQEATQDYFETQDYFSRWLEECCVLHDTLEAKPGDLLASFQAWCGTNGEEVTDNRRLRGMLEKIPGVRYCKREGVRSVRGIGLKPPKGAAGRGGAGYD
jgi:putative DNA primase/helicase